MKPSNTSLVVGLCVAVLLHSSPAQDGIHAKLSGEQSLRIRILGGYGSVYLRACDNDTLYSVSERSTTEGASRVSYRRDGSTGFLTIRLNKSDDDDEDLSTLSSLIRGTPSRTWDILLTNRVPMDVTISLGVGEADLDFSTLMMKSLKLESGIGTTVVRVERPNSEFMKSLTINAGIGTLKTSGLGNLRFQTLHFDGGMGSYLLDVTGALRDGSRVHADVGMGTLVIVLPEGIGVRAFSDESWFSSSSFRNFVRKGGDRYESRDFANALTRMSLHVASGFGSVVVKWKK